MIYLVLVGYDTGGEPIYIWKCDCEQCLTTTIPCRAVTKANMKEVIDRIIETFGKDKRQDSGMYTGLRR